MQELQGVRVVIPILEANGELYYDTEASITGSLVVAPLDITPETLFLDLLEGLVDQWTDPTNPEYVEGEDLELRARTWVEAAVGQLAESLTQKYNDLLDLAKPMTGADAVAKYLPPSPVV